MVEPVTEEGLLSAQMRFKTKRFDATVVKPFAHSVRPRESERQKSEERVELRKRSKVTGFDIEARLFQSSEKHFYLPAALIGEKS